MSCRGVASALVAAAIASAPAAAGATSLDPDTWEERVVRADAVGVLECTVAGVGVAEFQVVDAWKGLRRGDVVRVDRALPILDRRMLSRVGERYVMALHRVDGARAPRLAMDAYPGWWRDLDAEYVVPAFNEWSVTVEDGVVVGSLDRDVPELAAFKRRVLALLARDAAGQELALLQAVAREMFGDTESGVPGDISWTVPWSAYRAAVVRAHIDAAKTPAQAVAAATRAVRHHRDLRGRLAHVFERGGGPRTLAALEQLGARRSRLGATRYRDVVEALRDRAGGPAPDADPTLAGAQVLAFTRRASSGLAGAFAFVTDAVPDAAVGFLRAYRPAPRARRHDEPGYILAQWFGSRCRGEACAARYRSLTGAADPFVRVVGATYLTLVDPNAGLPALRELRALPAEPGALAALELARRGDAAAVPRALRACDPGETTYLDLDGDWWPSDFADSVCARVIALLSNGARLGGAPQPPAGDAHDALAAWWRDHADDVALGDPWLPELRAQQID